MMDLQVSSESQIDADKRPRDKFITISLIVGVIALVGCLLFGALYYMANADEEGLNAELLSRKDQLAGYQTVSRLEEKLVELQARLEEVRASHKEAVRLFKKTYDSGELTNGSIL